jgi:hypothetical protein
MLDDEMEEDPVKTSMSMTVTQVALTRWRGNN